jgi:MFS transporter, FSR family, fosmidomycin resistance protein
MNVRSTDDAQPPTSSVQPHFPPHPARTLWLLGVLHAFTHIYHVALVPLYLPIQRDLALGGVEQATLLQTVLMLAYFVPSYAMGILADRFDRRLLLSFGLALNGLGFVALAMAPNFAWAFASVFLAGIGGSFYHPSATAMIARLFPIGTGRALGLVGIGAGAGFFVSPIYTGWRAEMSGWRAPVLELGLLGMAIAAVFFLLARSPATHPPPSRASAPTPMFPTRTLWFWFALASILFGLRDFAGTGMGSLSSLFMQKVHSFGLHETGLTLSAIFLAAVISNPFFGGLSDRGRMRWTCFVLGIAALLVAWFPHVPPQWFVPVFALYGFFFMASYPMIEAALMESVPDAVRGRVYGLFITVGGLIGNLSHWQVGEHVHAMGQSTHQTNDYFPIYTTLALLILVSLAGLPCLHAIRKREAILAQPHPATLNPG